MKCPYCGEDMENGYIQSGGRMLTWVKEKRLISSLRPKAGEILLDDNILTGAAVSACLCRKCEKMIVDYFANE